MDYRETFRIRLRTLRKERHERQPDVAAAIDIVLRQYQRYESGDGLPGFDALVALADHFAVSLDYLTGRTDER